MAVDISPVTKVNDLHDARCFLWKVVHQDFWHYHYPLYSFMVNPLEPCKDDFYILFVLLCFTYIPSGCNSFCVHEIPGKEPKRTLNTVKV